MGHSTLEHTVQDRRHLDNIELRAVKAMARRLQQPGLEEFDRCRNTKEQREGDPVFPGAFQTLAVGMRCLGVPENLLEDSDQIAQQPGVETLTILEGDDDLF